MQCQRHIVISILAAVFTMTPSWAQSTSTLLQKGIFTEETVGDLDAAIKIYEQIVADAEKNRAYAAQAQYRIGTCYLKQGLNDRAVGAFQKLIEQFPKQNELVAQAKARLLKLGYTPGRTRPAEMTVRRVWEGSRVDTMGGPSLDGRYLSFVDWSTGDVAIRDLATGESRRLTNNKKGFRGEPVFPRFSPDGTQVAYGWFNYEDFSHDLRVVGIEDSEPRVLYANEEVIYIIPTAWSPDGKHILANFQRKDRTAQIVLVSIADGSVQVLKSLDWRYPRNMSFSPDGRYIVYDVPTKEDDPNHDIFLLATDGSREIALIEHSADDAFAAWAPDGKTVVFLSNRTGSMGVWAIQVASGKPVGIPRLVKQGIAERSNLMGFTRDGSLYYGHSARMNVGEVYTATLDIPAGKVVVQPTPASDRFVGSNTASDWSPDGQYLAFVSMREHGSKVIVIRSVETGEEREIPLTVGRFVTRPRWSPDGGSFLVEGSHKKDEGLYRVDAQTGDISRIVRGEPGTSNISRWAWSPDGKAIFFLRIDRSSKLQTIVRREFETGKEQIIVSSAMMPLIRDLALSPDGRQLALIRNDSKPGMSITVMPVRGGEPHEILRVKEPEFICGGFWREGLAWTPDGRYLLFGKARRDVEGQTVELWRVPVEGGEPQRLGVAMDNVRDVRVHPDGRRISFTAGKISAEVWKMENFLPEPKVAVASAMSTRRLWAGPDVDIMGAPSPDGRNLSYVDWETGDLAIRDLTTGRNRRLTNKGSWSESTGFAEFSVISPDGKQVAYAWFNEDFFYDLRIIKLDGSEPHVLYRNEEVEYVTPTAWSPDGRHILAAFSRKDRTSQIVLVGVADGSVRVLKTLDWRWPGKMSFSPDGRYIVYDFPPQEEPPERDIFLLATDGSREIALVEHPANDLFPVWVPDGKRILFGSDRTGTMGAWVIPVTEGKPQGSVELVKKDVGKTFPIGFTENGSYYYGILTGMNDVYIATLDLTTGKFLSSPVKATQRFVGANTSPDWSPDGRHLAYISQRGPLPIGLRSRIISIRSVETGQERELSPKLNYIGGPRWSPDGRSLLVTGRDEKGRQGHYQIDAQTGGVTPIVQSEPGVYFRKAMWSPDGKAIFYTRNESGTKSSSIVLRDLETSREKELYHTVSPSSGLGGLALSPDGQELAFVLSDQATRSEALVVMAAAGGEPRELLRVQEPASLAFAHRGGIAWTPDGREVLFGRYHSQSPQEQTIEWWRISVEGGEPQKLGLAMDQLRDLRIHPDGRQIAFSAGQYSAEVWVMENFLPELPAAK